MLRVSDHQRKTFTVEIRDTSNNVIAEATLGGVSFFKWNEIGMLVTPEKAKPIKDPKTKKYVEDEAAQLKLDQKATALRDGMRLAFALDEGGAFDWEHMADGTLEQKAEHLMTMDGDVYQALWNALNLWAFGKKVSAKEADDQFPGVSQNGHAGVSSESVDA